MGACYDVVGAWIFDGVTSEPTPVDSREKLIEVCKRTLKPSLNCLLTWDLAQKETWKHQHDKFGLPSAHPEIRVHLIYKKEGSLSQVLSIYLWENSSKF